MNLTRSEVIEQIGEIRGKDQFFIKTWEAGHTFVDIDLIDRFVGSDEKDRVIEGFKLLDMEEMWQTLIDLDPDKLNRVKIGESEVIEWTWKDSQGKEQKTVYPFTPQGIMTIIDDEFFA